METFIITVTAIASCLGIGLAVWTIIEANNLGKQRSTEQEKS